MPNTLLTPDQLLPMSVPTDAISGFFLGTTPIRYHGENGHATGFFLTHGETTYLITNRHAVDFETHNGEPVKRVRIYLWPDPDDVRMTEHHDLTLVTDGSPNWLTHDDSHIDMAAIPLTPPVVDEQIQPHDPLESGEALIETDHTTGNLAFTLADLPNGHRIEDGHLVTAIRGGSQAMLLGYPFDRGPAKLPVARSALISSPYGEPTGNQPYFRMDAKTHGD